MKLETFQKQNILNIVSILSAFDALSIINIKTRLFHSPYNQLKTVSERAIFLVVRTREFDTGFLGNTFSIFSPAFKRPNYSAVVIFDFALGIRLNLGYIG